METIVTDSDVTKVGVKDTGTETAYPSGVERVRLVLRETTPDATGEPVRVAASGLEEGKLLPVGDCVRQDDGRVARDAAQVVVEPVYRPADELVTAL